MKKEEKQLLLKDLCARLPYGVKIHNTSFLEPQIQTLLGRIDDDVFIMKETYKSVGVSGDDFDASCEKRYTGYLEFIKPYLRPMSSMTEEEEKVFNDFLEFQAEYVSDADLDNKTDMFDWLNKNHFDYRGLIPKGLALEAHEGMYN